MEVFDIVRNRNDIRSDRSSIFLNAPLLNRHIQEYIHIQLVAGGGMFEEESLLFFSCGIVILANFIDCGKLGEEFTPLRDVFL